MEHREGPVKLTERGKQLDEERKEYRQGPVKQKQRGKTIRGGQDEIQTGS